MGGHISRGAGPLPSAGLHGAQQPYELVATAAYSALSDDHTPAADNTEPGPGPLLSNAECTSGGEAIHSVIAVNTTED